MDGQAWWRRQWRDGGGDGGGECLGGGAGLIFPSSSYIYPWLGRRSAGSPICFSFTTLHCAHYTLPLYGGWRRTTRDCCDMVRMADEPGGGVWVTRFRNPYLLYGSHSVPGDIIFPLGKRCPLGLARSRPHGALVFGSRHLRFIKLPARRHLI